MSHCSKTSRREFLAVAAASSAALAVGVTPAGAQSAAVAARPNGAISIAHPFDSTILHRIGLQRSFTRDNLTQIAIPLGGIGTGSISINGYGGMQDFSIHARPENCALPLGFTSNSPEAAFAVLHIKGAVSATRVVEGPFPPFRIYDQGLQGQGLRRGGS